MNKGPVAIIVVLLQVLVAMGCASQGLNGTLSLDDCLDRLARRIEEKPVQTYLITLDGQKVNLSEFFRLSLEISPLCILPEKFYHWKKEVKMVTAKTLRGLVFHKIRIYHNYLSTCRPDLVDPGKTHGDVAEFYDENGEFMGLAVYVGQGLYYSLPYGGYKGYFQI
jgi:hypothetical protein